MPPRSLGSGRMNQLIALVVEEARRLEYGRSIDQRKPRPDPPDFIDISGLSVRAAAKKLGFPHVDDYSQHLIAKERSGQHDRAVESGRTRCEAGVKQWGLLRCHRMAVKDDRWCQQHHPSPPPPLQPTRRLSEYDLGLRPDGPLLEAIYELSDRSDTQNALLNVVLQRLERLERPADPDDGRALDMEEAATYLGLSEGYLYQLTTRNEVAFVRQGRRKMFRRKDLDAWLAERVVPAVRRRRD